MNLLKKYVFKSGSKEFILNKLECDDVLNTILFQYCKKTIVEQAINFDEINKYYVLIKKIVSSREASCDSIIEVNQEEIELLVENLKAMVYEQVAMLSKIINEPLFSEEEKLCKKVYSNNTKLNLLIQKGSI